MVQIRRLTPVVPIRKLADRGMAEVQHLNHPNGSVRNRRVMVVERRRKDFLPPTPMPTPCVIWQGSVDPDGYGRRKIKVEPGVGPNQGWRTISMHRWIVETVTGRKLRKEQVIMHLCDNPPCYRYDHLRIGTTQTNTADMVAKKRNVKPPVHHYNGSMNPNARFSEANIERVRELADQGYYQKTIAEMTGISKSHVQRILAGKTWWHQHFPNVKGNFNGRRATEPRREPGSEHPASDRRSEPEHVEADPHADLGDPLAQDPPQPGQDLGRHDVRSDGE